MELIDDSIKIVKFVANITNNTIECEQLGVTIHMDNVEGIVEIMYTDSRIYVVCCHLIRAYDMNGVLINSIEQRDSLITATSSENICIYHTVFSEEHKIYDENLMFVKDVSEYLACIVNYCEEFVTMNDAGATIKVNGETEEKIYPSIVRDIIENNGSLIINDRQYSVLYLTANYVYCGGGRAIWRFRIDDLSSFEKLCSYSSSMDILEYFVVKPYQHRLKFSD